MAEDAADKHGRDSETPRERQTRTRWLPRTRVFLLGVVVGGLLGMAVFATLHEKPISATPSVGAHGEFEPMRPPLTAAEEAYAAVLWPIHSAVKLSAVNASQGAAGGPLPAGIRH